MSYSYDRFLRPVTSTDRNIQIMNNNGTIDYTINPFSIINILVNNNLLKINLKSGRVITIPFSSQNESKLAIIELQVSLNTWYQVVYVWTNSGLTKTLETFINGSSIGTVNHSFTSILNSTNPLYLGSYNNGEYIQYFSGNMGIVRLYNSALSSSDVLKNFEANRNTYGI